MVAAYFGLSVDPAMLVTIILGSCRVRSGDDRSQDLLLQVGHGGSNRQVKGFGKENAKMKPAILLAAIAIGLAGSAIGVTARMRLSIRARPTPTRRLARPTCFASGLRLLPSMTARPGVEPSDRLRGPDPGRRGARDGSPGEAHPPRLVGQVAAHDLRRALSSLRGRSARQGHGGAHPQMAAPRALEGAAEMTGSVSPRPPTPAQETPMSRLSLPLSSSRSLSLRPQPRFRRRPRS